MTMRSANAVESLLSVCDSEVYVWPHVNDKFGGAGGRERVGTRGSGSGLLKCTKHTHTHTHTHTHLGREVGVEVPHVGTHFRHNFLRCCREPPVVERKLKQRQRKKKKQQWSWHGCRICARNQDEPDQHTLAHMYKQLGPFTFCRSATSMKLKSLSSPLSPNVSSEACSRLKRSGSTTFARVRTSYHECV